MVYLWIGIAVIFEVGWAIAMKLSHGFTRPGPAVATVIMYLLSVVFLSFATRRMDVGVAYAVWAGSGAALIAAAGIIYFKEPVSTLKVASIGLIIAGIAGLQLADGGH
jgi:multidrug transporter EmrE-like cation transporter